MVVISKQRPQPREMLISVLKQGFRISMKKSCFLEKGIAFSLIVLEVDMEILVSSASSTSPCPGR